jgi:hypothetical protein
VPGTVSAKPTKNAKKKSTNKVLDNFENKSSNNFHDNLQAETAEVAAELPEVQTVEVERVEAVVSIDNLAAQKKGSPRKKRKNSRN